MGTLDAVYKSYQIETSLEIEPFNRYIEVYGVKIAGLKATGGNVAVEDEFIRKIAQRILYSLLGCDVRRWMGRS